MKCSMEVEQLRPNGQRAKNAIILIWVILVLEIISFISGYFEYDLLRTIANGGEFSMEVANANDLRQQVIAIFYLIAYIISIVTFIQWFRRAYFNLHLKVNYLVHNDVWAAGSWFVPIINFYRPYQIMKEMYRETKRLLLDNGISLNRDFTTNTLGWWWTLWIISAFIGRFIFRFSLKAETVAELTISTVADMVMNVIGILLALITIVVIKDYAKVEPLLYEVGNDKEKATNDREAGLVN